MDIHISITEEEGMLMAASEEFPIAGVGRTRVESLASWFNCFSDYVRYNREWDVPDAFPTDTPFTVHVDAV